MVLRTVNLRLLTSDQSLNLFTKCAGIYCNLLQAGSSHAVHTIWTFKVQPCHGKLEHKTELQKIYQRPRIEIWSYTSLQLQLNEQLTLQTHHPA